MLGKSSIFQLLRIRTTVSQQGQCSVRKLDFGQHRFLHAAATSRKKKLSPTIYALLLIPGSAFGLGCWQVQRRQWKLSLIKELEDKISQPPVPLPLEESEFEKLEYQRVTCSGTFDHSREVYMGPRPLLRNGRSNETGSLISRGSSGFLVVTPFTLQESGKTILVNRGWVPKKLKNPANREDGQVTGVQELTGVVRLQENRSPFMPRNQSRDMFFIYRDVESMAAVTGASPVFLDACDGPPAGPVVGQTRVTLRNEHLSYLITWYSLSFFTGFLWYQRYVNPRALL